MTARLGLDIQEAERRILAVVAEEGIPVLGTAAAAEMRDEPPGRRPTDVLPGARGLLCFGLPVPGGVYGAAAHQTETVWRAQNVYYRRLDTLSLKLAAVIEDLGERALPVFGCQPMGYGARREVRGYLNQLRMGAAARIGFIGRNGLLLHDRYGSRLMLGGLVTTATLPVIRHGGTGDTGCPPDCRVCIDVCPVGAISMEKERVAVNRCLAHTARTPLLPRLRYLALLRFRPERAERMMNQLTFDEHTLHVCNLCVSRCPYGEDLSTRP